MKKDIAQDILSDKYPEEIPFSVKSQLYMIGEKDDRWDYMETNNSMSRSLHNKFLISTSGIIFSLISNTVIGLTKENNKLHLVGKKF